MKKNFFRSSMMGLMALAFLASCNSDSGFPGYKKTSNGLYYRFHQRNATGAAPKNNDFMKVSMTCYLHDTLYYDWNKANNEVYTQLSRSKFAGDLQEAYAMLHVGDSASFYIKADSVAVRYYGQNPAAVGLTPDDYLRYEVKLLDIKTREEFQADIDRMKEQMMAASKASFERYIKENGISVNPSETGVYVVTKEAGKGRCPVKGEKVELDFELKLMDGTVIGSTYGQEGKFSFVLGEGFVIDGWEEVVPKMHLGERVQAIIPFDMAYGEHSVDAIPAYANLVYDMKLLKISTKEEIKKQSERDAEMLKTQSEKDLAAFVAANNMANRTPSGLYYVKFNTTDGEAPVEGKVVRIKYTAYMLDGTKLGSTDDLGGYYDIPFGKGVVLPGLEEGVGMLKVGEKARFVMPCTLAYGEKAYGKIPAYSNLIFDVEVLEVRESE